ncbi:MAG: LytTR family DNA-binding domain-containing protein [Eubacteriales bacterium]|nr:LytTR family DNA-binding domain-containing protein [Eubacteriales bacterium]
MHVIICDDEKITCAELERILTEYSSERGVKLQTDVFFSGDALIDYLYKEEAPDILFLDIELPGVNGVVVGDYVRRILENEQIFIVYISSKEQYALQLFKNRPFDFLVKPLNAEKIFRVLDNIYRIVGKSNCDFEYQNKGITYRVQYRDILYFQSIGRKINIVLRQETKGFYGKLTDVEAKLPKYLFLNIHKSYLINFNYVKEYTYEWVKMVNGDILNISKANRAEVRRKILEREANELRNY